MHNACELAVYNHIGLLGTNMAVFEQARFYNTKCVQKTVVFPGLYKIFNPIFPHGFSGQIKVLAAGFSTLYTALIKKTTK